MFFTNVFPCSTDDNMMLYNNIFDCFEEEPIDQTILSNIIKNYNTKKTSKKASKKALKKTSKKALKKTSKKLLSKTKKMSKN